MKSKKYLASNGIAFSEEKDLELLRKYAAKGWMVKRYKMLGYELERQNPEDVIFSIDIRKVNDGEKEEYIEMFKMAGWTHVATNYYTHLFKALPGTKPIYTDIQSKKGKYIRMRQPLNFIVLISFLSVIISFLAVCASSGTIQIIFGIVGYLSLIVALPMLMTWCSTWYHSFRTKV
jgi:hypothetical protein